MRIPQGFPRLPADWEYETEVHESLDREHSLFFNVYKRTAASTLPKQNLRGLLIVHGQGEHGGRYQHFAHYLKDQYDLIVAVDLRGHGRSEGVRGHVEKFDEYVDDVLLAWKWLGERCDSRDWFGHSMGGLVTLCALHAAPDLGAKRVILSSPLVGLRVEVPLIKHVAATVLRKVWGSLQLETGLDASKVSHDPAVVEAYLQDQLNHSKATPAFYFAMQDAMRRVTESEIRLPTQTALLLQVAAEDEIVDSAASLALFDRLHVANKKRIEYPGLYHEIYNEPTREKVFADWIDWMKSTAL